MFPPCNVDKWRFSGYTARTEMKKLIFVILVLMFLAVPARVLAQDSQIICPQPYGGGVVCGVHTVVNTGIGDNLALIGGGLLVSSVLFLVLSKKFKKISA